MLSRHRAADTCGCTMQSSTADGPSTSYGVQQGGHQHRRRFIFRQQMQPRPARSIPDSQPAPSAAACALPSPLASQSLGSSSRTRHTPLGCSRTGSQCTSKSVHPSPSMSPLSHRADAAHSASQDRQSTQALAPAAGRRRRPHALHAAASAAVGAANAAAAAAPPIATSPLTQLVAVVLGYAVLVGSCFRSVPQIIKIVQNRSADGLSLTANLMELMCYTVIVAYNFNKVCAALWADWLRALPCNMPSYRFFLQIHRDSCRKCILNSFPIASFPPQAYPTNNGQPNGKSPAKQPMTIPAKHRSLFPC